MGLKLKSLFEHFFYATDLVSIRTIFGSLPQSTTRPTFSMVGSHVPYKSLAELRAAYMPDVAWAFSGLPQADPGGRVTPRFCHRLIPFRHFNSGSLALASLNHACWDHVPTFPQRSPPSLLTTAACGGLRSAPDCRTRRALLHLPYSCALPCGRAMLVTQNPDRTCRQSR